MGKNSGQCYPFLSYVTVLFERFSSPFWHNVFLEKKNNDNDKDKDSDNYNNNDYDNDNDKNNNKNSNCDELCSQLRPVSLREGLKSRQMLVGRFTSLLCRL